MVGSSRDVQFSSFENCYRNQTLKQSDMQPSTNQEPKNR